MRIHRVLGFATVHFFIYVISFIFTEISTYGATSEGAWYLQHPLQALFKMILVLGRNPIMFFSFFILALYSLIFGFVTDLVYSSLRRYIQSRKQRTS